MRQAVDQVEVYAAHTRRSQLFGRSGCVFKTLNTIDGLLHGGVEALHAEAGPRDAARAEFKYHLTGERARIDLDGHLSVGKKSEFLPQNIHQF